METCADGNTREEPKVFSLPILGIIHQSQSIHGLKHSEYSRYRQYCARRLQRIYKGVKLLHGRGRFQKKVLTADAITDDRMLHIPLVCAERAWSYAMDIKNEVEQSNAPVKRHHMIRRLTKACVHARDLVRLASATCDTRTSLEAEAYAAWLVGTLHLEKGKNWDKGIAQFHHARSLLNELFKVSDYDQRTGIRYLLDQVEPAIRFCEYQLSRSGKPVQDIYTVGSGSLATRLEALAAETSLASTGEAVSEIEWNGEQYPIRDERCRLKVHAAQQLVASVDSLTNEFLNKSEKEQDAEIDGMIQQYDKAVNAFSDAKSCARSAAQLASMSEERQIELNSLGRALQGMELNMTIQRNVILSKTLENRLNRSIKRRLLPGNKLRDKSEKPARPEELVRIYDTLIANVTALNDIAVEVGGARGEILMDSCAAKISQFQAARCYYIAHKYLSEEGFAEAYALFSRTEQKCETALERIEEAADADEIGKAEVHSLANLAHAFKVAAQAEFYSAQLNNEKSAIQGVKGMELDESQKNKGEERGTMLENLTKWESFAGDSKAGAEITRIPPPPKFVPVGPIVLDTALMCIEPPSLAHRIKNKPGTGAGSSAGGMVSRLFGWS